MVFFIWIAATSGVEAHPPRKTLVVPSSPIIFEPYETSCVSTQLHQLERWRGRPSTQVLEVVEPLIMLRSSEMKRKIERPLKRLEFHRIRSEKLFQRMEGCAFGCCECVTNTKWTFESRVCQPEAFVELAARRGDSGGGNMVSWVWTKFLLCFRNTRCCHGKPLQRSNMEAVKCWNLVGRGGSRVWNNQHFQISILWCVVALLSVMPKVPLENRSWEVPGVVSHLSL